MTVFDKHEFYTIANSQGQKRLFRETFEEFEKRVLTLYEKRNSQPAPWRVENAAAKDKAVTADANS